MIEPLQSYYLPSHLETNFFTDPESLEKCVEVIYSFGDQLLRPEFDSWDSVEIHGGENNIQELSKSCEAVQGAIDVESSSFSCVVQSPDKLALQRETPAERPELDLPKTERSDAF